MATSRYRRSRAKPLADLKRPRRRLGEQLRPLLNCPLCLGGRIDVMRWGENTTRLACDGCGLRFSIDLGQLARTLREPAREGRFEAIGAMFGGMILSAMAEMKAGDLADGGAEEIGELIEQLRHVKPEGHATRRPWPKDTETA